MISVEKILSPVLSNWPLIAVAIWAIIVAVQTLHTIREQTEATRKAAEATAQSVEAINRQVGIMERQTKAAEDAAEAAKASAEALVRSERAWLVVSVESRSMDDYNFAVKNYGRTPAAIYAVQSLHFAPPRNVSLSMVPDYGIDCRLPHERIVVPDEKWGFAAINPRHELAAEWQEIHAGARPLYQLGIVRYRDVLTDEKHETRFCFQFDTPTGRWETSGPTREYNAWT